MSPPAPCAWLVVLLNLQDMCANITPIDTSDALEIYQVSKSYSRPPRREQSQKQQTSRWKNAMIYGDRSMPRIMVTVPTRRTQPCLPARRPKRKRLSTIWHRLVAKTRCHQDGSHYQETRAMVRRGSCPLLRRCKGNCWIGEKGRYWISCDGRAFCIVNGVGEWCAIFLSIMSGIQRCFVLQSNSTSS